MTRTVVIVQARMASTRLPGKVLLDLGGRPILAWVVDAAGRIPAADAVVVATSDRPADDAIADWCGGHGIALFRGDENDVLSRFAGAAEATAADVVVRVTADCPFLDPQVVGTVLALRRRTGVDYASNTLTPSWPDGLDCEVFTRQALEAARDEAVAPSDREHVTPFLYRNRARFSTRNLMCPVPGVGGHRWTVDDERDLALVRAVAGRLGAPSSWLDILALVERHAEVSALNAATLRNEGYATSRRADPVAPVYDYPRSQAMLLRACRTVPLGSQTFSKAAMQYPQGHAPLFASHGRGGRLWDVDGREYVDLVMGLLPLVLGYGDPDVDDAIRDQLDRGILFSLASELEHRVAEAMCEMIPCAERVRFGKNGSDATAGAIRLARAFTGRDHVVVCGYHGWQDWYIGSTTRHRGVPAATRALTHRVPFNDPGALEACFGDLKGRIAAVILEPMNLETPNDGYLAAVRDIARDDGALLVFDEVITGFRFAPGGAQELFGVTPDLACFGKGMGNGTPISAVAGRADVMQEMEEIFFSFTYGGEALSLAAALATLEKIRREPVLETIAATGQRLADDVEACIDAHALADVIRLTGHPSWKILVVHDHPEARKEAIRTLLLKEMLARSVLVSASHNICYAHGPDDVARTVAAWDAALTVVADELATGRLEDRLGFPAIEPVFRVR